MTLNFFSGHRDDEKSAGKRYAALQTVRIWLNSRPFLPQDFKRALLFLLPELKDKPPAEFEHHADFED